MSYLNAPFGSISAPIFSIPGLLRLAVIEKAKITSITGGGQTGADVTAIALAVGAKFQEITFVEGSAQYTNQKENKHIAQTVAFRAESDEIAKVHSLILGPKYTAIVQKGNGKWILLGQTNGLMCSEFADNSEDEDGAKSFTLSGKNLGSAPNVVMTDTELETMISSAGEVTA